MEDSGFEMYVRALRKGLRGLPRPDVDDIVAEMRSHVEETVAEGGSVGSALNDLSPAERVAVEIIEKRVRRADGETVGEASRGRRFAAWLADMTLGWVPLVVNPAWLGVLGLVQVRFWMTEETRQQLARTPGFEMPSFPLVSLLVLTLCLAWGLYYWLGLRRSRSASVGMRMAGLSRVITADGLLIVRTADIAEGEAACIVSRPKWYLAAPIVPILVASLLFGFYLEVMIVGSFFQPFNPLLPPETGDNGSSQAVVSVFYDAVLDGDVEVAKRYLADDASIDIEAFVADRNADAVESWALGPGNPSDYWYVVEKLNSGKKRTVLVLVERVEQQGAPGETTIKYRVRDCSDAPVSADLEDPE